jgi:antitoxin ParD1/3/4
MQGPLIEAKMEDVGVPWPYRRWKMDLAVSPDLEQIVREKVESGCYASTDEVLREALQLLDDRDRLRAWKLEELRKEVAIGLREAEQGLVAPLDMDSVRAKVAERLRAQEKDS